MQVYCFVVWCDGGCGRLQVYEVFEQFRLVGVDYVGEVEDFVLMYGERYVVYLVWYVGIVYCKYGCVDGLCCFCWIECGEFLVYYQMCYVYLVQCVVGMCVDYVVVLQYGYFVGQLLYFFQLVVDVQYGDVVGFQLEDDFEQVFDFVVGEYCCGFVEDYELVFVEQCLCDLYQLLVGQWYVLYQGCW